MKLWIYLFLIFLLTSEKSKASCTLAVTINNAISASTVDYIDRAHSRALESQCGALFIRMNTPGGTLQSTRLIVEKILASTIPVICLISPTGGHASSAGAIILQACHINGGLKATNLGAATPILSTGGDTPPDLRSKLINDTVSWLMGFTKLRGRNLKISKEIVTEAKSLTVEEAVKEKVLDILAQDEDDFINQALGRSVLVGNDTVTFKDKGVVQEFLPDLRYRILSFVADPEFAYLLFMGSLGLLYVEVTHPGLIAPGVIGGIGLVLSLVAFHKLEVVWGGLALILLGILFLVLEIFVPSFGALGVGGLISLFVGSLFLFDTEATGYALPLSLISSVVGVLAIFMGAIGYLALKTMRLKSRDMDSDLKDSIGIVSRVEENGTKGQLEIQGETWNFTSDEGLSVGDSVQVMSRQGLVLKVRKK
jgi:membrane-bound serine protease (ClpP class)